MSRERVCALADVPAGEVRAVACGKRSIAVANVGGELRAIDNICTHDGGPLGDGRLDGDRILCPRHGAAFDSRSGRALTLPAVREVRAYEVTVEGDDVYVEYSE
ncbi:MAG: non-heme iron oxygenase ferredoxin subunit [Chloroflexi bacterium]|nr:non-heme iron oxygenase ferredoxin subunit [Chloroflexota bacterium]